MSIFLRASTDDGKTRSSNANAAHVKSVNAFRVDVIVVDLIPASTAFEKDEAETGADKCQLSD